MADKPRVKAPKQRAGAAADDGGRRTRTLAVLAAAAAVALAFGVVAVALGMVGGGGETDIKRAADRARGLPAARCRSLRLSKACTRFGTRAGPRRSGTPILRRVARTTASRRSSASTTRSSSSPGSCTTSSTAASSSCTARTCPTRPSSELRSFYDDHKTGTIMAPLNRLGDKFALGAWVVDGETKQRVPREVHELRRRARSRRSSARSSSAGPSDSTRASSSPGM